jgi:hypothetical protein
MVIEEHGGKKEIRGIRETLETKDIKEFFVLVQVGLLG